MSSGHIPQEHYEAKSGSAKWLENRLPLLSLSNHMTAFPTPKNLNWMWVFGAILAVCLVIQIATGVALAMWYTPHADHAFHSVEMIMRDVNGGWWLRYVHQNGAHFFFIAVYLHMFRGLYYGSYKPPREILWIIGILILLLMMATAFMGYVLPYGQMSHWGAQVITDFFGAVPVVGENLVIWLRGNFAVGDNALNRFFALHYLLPFAIAGLVMLHIWALHHVGNNNPTGVPVRNESIESVKRDTVPFNPYYTVKDLFAIIVFLIVMSVFVFFMPNYLGHADNYIPAKPLVTPSHIVPEWYFLPFYAILRSIPNELIGIIAMFAAIAIMAVLPWLDTSRTRSGAYRPMFKQFFWLFVVACIGLGYVGAKTPDGIIFASTDTVEFSNPEDASAHRASIVAADSDAVVQPVTRIDTVGEPSVWEVTEVHMAFRYIHLGQILTFYYFAYFLLILPLLGLFERPRQTPDSIESDFAARKRKAASDGDASMSGAAAPAE